MRTGPLMLPILLCMFLAPPEKQAADDPSAVMGRSFAVYALSRGAGVPTQTRTAFRAIRQLLEELRAQGKVRRMSSQRIGLEGETRLCAEFADEVTASAALAKVKQRAAGVELLNVMVEPCPGANEP